MWHCDLSEQVGMRILGWAEIGSKVNSDISYYRNGLLNGSKMVKLVLSGSRCSGDSEFEIIAQ